MDMNKMVAELRRDEGVMPSAYQDSLGWWTIGVGRLIDKRKGGKLSDDEINYLLNNDIERFSKLLDINIPWWRTLDDVRQRVLLNMAFNLGVNGLLSFKNTLAYVKSGDYTKAASNMLLSKWATQVKGRATRLSEMMRTGQA
ncbi:glycoside hydrolase family protein [Neisseriaceae bacterium CLB008]